jgi:hypothetical protein
METPTLDTLRKLAVNTVDTYQVRAHDVDRHNGFSAKAIESATDTLRIQGDVARTTVLNQAVETIELEEAMIDLYPTHSRGSEAVAHLLVEMRKVILES